MPSFITHYSFNLYRMTTLGNSESAIYTTPQQFLNAGPSHGKGVLIMEVML
jgi:hypothetical protein